MLTPLEVLAVSKAYTNETVDGAGAIKGAPCTIYSIEDIEGGQRVTFKWTTNSGQERTSIMDVMNGEDGPAGPAGKGISSIQQVEDEASIIIYYTDGTHSEPIEIPTIPGFSPEITVETSTETTYTLRIKTEDDEFVTPNLKGGGSGGSAVLTDDLTASVSVGGVSAGDTFEAGDTLESVIRDILEPTLYPSITPPSVTISVPTTLFESGTDTYVQPTTNANRGSINPAYGTNGYRAGAPNNTDGSWWYFDVQMDSWTEWLGSHSNGFRAWDGRISKWRKTIYFADGEQPKDSKGNNYMTPYHNEDGEDSNVITFKYVDAIWANTSNISTVAKLTLLDNTSTKQKDLSFPAQTVANPEIFDIPASWNVTAVQVKNDLSGAWEDASSQFTITDTTHKNAGNTNVNYKRYTFNMGVATGARQIRVKWS